VGLNSLKSLNLTNGYPNKNNNNNKNNKVKSKPLELRSRVKIHFFKGDGNSWNSEAKLTGKTSRRVLRSKKIQGKRAVFTAKLQFFLSVVFCI
jgi:hypothetical protein